MQNLKKIVLTDLQERWLIKHFKHTKNDEIMARLGISNNTLHRFARDLGLSKSRQFMRKCQENTTRAAWIANRRRGWPPKGYRIPGAYEAGFKKGITPQMRLGKKRNEERIRKSAESRRKTVAAERRRIMFGLPQRTKLKIGHSCKKASYRYALRKRGYIVERGGSDAVVTDTTLRCPPVEQRAAKYGIRVIIKSEPI